MCTLWRYGFILEVNIPKTGLFFTAFWSMKVYCFVAVLKVQKVPLMSGIKLNLFQRRLSAHPNRPPFYLKRGIFMLTLPHNLWACFDGDTFDWRSLGEIAQNTNHVWTNHGKLAWWRFTGCEQITAISFR